MLILRDVNFGNAVIASGGGNFFKQQPWWYRPYFELLPGVDSEGATHAAKTSTLPKRDGNMPLDENLQPKEWLPDCIKIYWFRRFVLNAVGLSGPGLAHLLHTGLWQEILEPFIMSLMAVGATKEERIKEVEEMASLIVQCLDGFKARFGIELNISCPNTSHCPMMLADEAVEQASCLRIQGLPVIIKLNALTPIESVADITRSGACDAISLSNTIPFGELPEWIPWHKMVKNGRSPLAKYGGGGYSGWHLLFVVADFLRRMEEAGIRIPVIAGGGALYPHDVDFLAAASPNNLKAISIGSVRLLRSWNERRIIKRANEILGERI